MSSSPLNTRYHRERTIRTGRAKLAGWSPGDVAKVLKRQGKAMPAAAPVLCPRCGHDLTGANHGRPGRDQRQR